MSHSRAGSLPAPTPADPDLDIDTSLVQLEVDEATNNDGSGEESPPIPMPSEVPHEIEENLFEGNLLEMSVPEQSIALLAELNRQRLEGRLLDLQLYCNGVTLPCHRCVLAASSPYFRKALCVSGEEQSRLCLDNFKPEAVAVILDFIYTGRIKLHELTAGSVLSAACILEYPVVVNLCVSFLRGIICASNCLGISHLSHEYGCTELQVSAWHFALEHPSDVFRQDEFLQLSAEQVVEFISDDDLNASKEDDIYEAAMAWVGHDECNRASDLPSVLQHVKLPLLSGRVFAGSLESHPLLINCDECRQLVREARHLRDLALKGKETHSQSLKPRPSTVSNVLVVVGGMETSRKWVKDVIYYDPEAKMWDSLTTLPFSQTDYSVTSLKDDIYVSGGFQLGNATPEVWCYRTALNKWVEVANLKLARFNHTSTGMDGMVYVVGGETDDAGLTEIERYDPERNTWEVIGEANPTESNLSVAGLNQKLYIIGWLVHARLMCAVQCFDLRTKECMIQPCSGLNRQLFPVITFQDSIYILGGSRIKEVAIYDPETYQSVKAEPMRYKRNTPSAAVVGRHLYVVGGELRHHLDKVEFYDPASSSWSMTTSMPKGLCFHGCVGVRKYLGPPYREPRMHDSGTSAELSESPPDIIEISNESA